MDPNLRQKLESVDWDEILEKLYAHSILRINWFGLKSEIRMKGLEAKDFTNEAVTLLWEGKRKWDETKEPDLINYLKSVINSIIYNMVKSKEREMFLDKDLADEINDSLFVDLMFEEGLIGEDFLDRLEETLLDDEEMWLVYKSLLEGMKPEDIEDKYGVDIEVVRNAQKRLRRHIKRLMNL